MARHSAANAGGSASAAVNRWATAAGTTSRVLRGKLAARQSQMQPRGTMRIHIKNNHASPETFPPTPEGEAVFTHHP